MPGTIKKKAITIMTTEQARSIIDHTRDFHRRISLYYHRLADSTQKQRVKLLLDYMSEHEQRLANCISDYEETAPTSIMNTWFQSASNTDAGKSLQDIELEPNQSVDDIIDLGIQVSECVLVVYRNLVDQVEPESVQQVFANLLSMEEKAQKQFSRDAGRLADL
jgi:rubrerythrin